MDQRTNDIESLILVQVLTICLGLWIVVLVRRWRGHPLLTRAPHSSSPLGLVDVALIIGVWLIAQLLAGVLLAGVLALKQQTPDKLMSSPFVVALGGASQLATFALALGYVKLRYPGQHIFGWNNPARLVSVGVCGFFMWIPLVWAIQTITSQLVPYQHQALELVVERGDPAALLTSWVTAVLIAPVVEEFFFRGVLQAWLQRIRRAPASGSTNWIVGGAAQPGATKEIVYLQDEQTSPPETPVQPPAALPTGVHWPAIAIASALFGLVHLGQGLAFIPLTVFGLCLGYMYDRTGSIVPCIVTHMLLNGLTMLILTLSVMS